MTLARGAWGLEVLAVLAAWKLASPGAVTLLRGNHESATCTAMYGFRAELVAKYSAVRLEAGSNVVIACGDFLRGPCLAGHGRHVLHR